MSAVAFDPPFRAWTNGKRIIVLAVEVSEKTALIIHEGGEMDTMPIADIVSEWGYDHKRDRWIDTSIEEEPDESE